jgi:subtilisin family serine protease
MSKAIIALFFFPLSLLAQSNRYFVAFKDKANTIYSTTNPSQFLSQKSIDRRNRENFVTTEEDFPVNATYVQQVQATGAQVYFTSRWFNGVLIQTTSSIASTVSNLSFVQSIELVAPGQRLSGGRTKASKRLARTSASVTEKQNTMIGLDKMHDAGFYGDGIDVAVFDAGFNGADTLTAFSGIYKDGRVKSVFNFVQNTSNVYAGDPHGVRVLSILAAHIPNRYEGGVPNANYFLYQTEDASSEYRIEEYNWLFAAEKADSAGVDVVNSSVGYTEFDDPAMNYTYTNMNGKTTVIARAAQRLIDRGVVVVNAAGNEGDTSWRYVISPADVNGVIACGGVDDSRLRISFSSVGPSSDGRIKPDVSALGEGNLIVDEDGKIFTESGTSFASPLVACLAVGLRQAYPQASAKYICKLIVESASQFARPDNLLGYGIPDFNKMQDVLSRYQVYPNPIKSDSRINIDFDFPDGQALNVQMFNSTGQKIFDGAAVVSMGDNPYSIDSSLLATGMYYLKIQTATGTKTVRVVKAY